MLIQADSNRPFYARINGTLFSSSDIGHLIIPQLKDTPQSVTIGFPKNIFPEENFVISLNKKDQSFQLKNLGKRGWALFNSLTRQWQMPVRTDTTVPKAVADIAAHVDHLKRDDAFSLLMAGVVNDTSILYNNSVEEKPKKEAETTRNLTASDIGKNNTLTANNNTYVIKTTDKDNLPTTAEPLQKSDGQLKQDTLNKPVAKAKTAIYTANDSIAVQKNLSYIKKLSALKTDSGFRIQYVDIPNKGTVDTIDIMIPFHNDRPLENIKKAEAVSNREIKAQKSRDTIRSLIDSTVAITNKSGMNHRREDTLHAAGNKVAGAAVNKDCRNFANDYDVDKLRVKMLSIGNDDDKIMETRTMFNLKCFSVKQVRALSEVFKTDEGRYRLFDAMYPHISDTGNFIQLLDLLSDPYYIKRFNAMIR